MNTSTLVWDPSIMSPKALYHAGDLNILCAAKIEGQFFERKSKRDPDRLAETICAFANANTEHGGLLAVGISDNGSIDGLRNRNDVDVNKLVQYHYYTGTPTQYRFLDCVNTKGQRDQVLLIYIPYLPNRVAETSKGKAYIRRGDESVELRDTERRELEYQKGQISFEDEEACPCTTEVLLGEVLDEFRQSTASTDRVPIDLPVEQLLISRHLAVKRDGQLRLTKAGVLLLARDPRALLPGAYVRFIRYQGTEKKTGADHNAVKDETFSDPLPRLFLRITDFLRSQVRELSYLGADGRFVREPEYPEFVWQEAIVNALVHRSYSLTNTPIMVEMYDDRLEITSPGDYPAGVTPREFIHNPRNPRLMDGMRALRFVRMLSEGSMRMRQEMLRANLPEPGFSPIGNPYVRVILRNDFERRTARSGPAPVSEYANLFRLTWSAQPPTDTEVPTPRELRVAFEDALKANGYAIDSFVHDRAVDPRVTIDDPELKGTKLFTLHPGFIFRLMPLSDGCYLALDHDIQVKNRTSVARIIELAPFLRNRLRYRGFARYEETWQPCRILEVAADGATRVRLFRPVERETTVPGAQVIPSLPATIIAELVQSARVSVDLHRIVKKHSLNLLENAARARAQRTEEIATQIAREVFPLRVREYRIDLNPSPTVLKTPGLQLRTDLSDVQPVFSRQVERTATTIINGLSTWGSYEKPDRAIPLVLLCTPDVEQAMKRLVTALQRGQAKFRGIEKTFALAFGDVATVLAGSPEEYVETCKKLCPHLPPDAFFLVYAPEGSYSRADYRAPYYQIKHFLLEAGFGSQMVDETTLANPSWKDYNLALDIFAKAGHVPWVLSEGLPNADLFMGLSYSSIDGVEGRTRMIGYVNVFDRYGKWLYYKGNTRVIRFEERNTMFRELLEQVAREYTARANLQRVHVHHAFKLRDDARREISAGITTIAPGAEVSFVHVNEHTRLRLYDRLPTGDGSLRRGAYVLAGPNRFFIATTGQNEFGQKGVGTPRPLEIFVNRVQSKSQLDTRVYAQHILSLTRLNWASTKDFCRVPITLKFAGDIAYLMNVFLSSFGSFTLHPRLERTPWFL